MGKRRFFWPDGELHPGQTLLPEGLSHHLCRVLRLPAGSVVELFDAQGQLALATLENSDTVNIAIPCRPAQAATFVTVAVAPPKGERADWLVEKLTELGVDRIVWLQCARSVVNPKGAARHGRWQRLCQAAAAQAGRNTLPTLEGPLSLQTFMANDPSQTRCIAHPGGTLLAPLQVPSGTLMVGPEGGFTPEELQQAERAGYTRKNLGKYVLRIETAAMAGAAIMMGGAPLPVAV